ncbi:MAG TPA: c-type cytochrome [Gammaproteobacteria bacterium]
MRFGALLLLGLLLAPPAAAQPRQPVIPAALLAAFEATRADPARLEQARRDGAGRAVFCAQCHGEDGNSTRAYVPKLAGQNPAYLLEQLQRFADGRRNHYVMVPLALNMSDADKVGLALHFAASALRPAEYNARLAARGAGLYREGCLRCHAADGRGEPGYARLAGQQPEYLVNALNGYRARDPRRGSAEMTAAVSGFDEAQLEALAHYASSLR